MDVDHATPAGGAAPRERLFTFRSGGWALLLSLILAGGVLAYWAARLPLRTPTAGDGRHVHSYAFDLSHAQIPVEGIYAAGFPKDGLPALVNPLALTRNQLDQFTRDLRRGHQGKFLVGHDRVIGVEIGGQARAYPLSILNWHEIVNDTLSGVPIAVTYNPLCDSAVVFDRRVEDQTLEFGVSGLVYNSNLLMYDRQPEHRGESLWSQLQFKAVAGPAAARGAALSLVPARVVHWADWQAAHPDTTVLAPDASRWKLYKRTYEPYFGTDELRFAVRPLPPDALPRKTPVLAVWTGARWHVLTRPMVESNADADGVWQATLDDVPVRVSLRKTPVVLWAEREDGEPLTTVSAFWFAWYAMHGG
ncbi:MAG: DUF3179 domain-containing protein [Phycisphaerales bacterium]|nr:DUF3179 domain-containing protein [Phycisphaerales bacterium]